MAEPACPVCGDEASRPLAGPARPWRYLRCRHCRHAWLAPIPSADELYAYYNTAYRVPRERYLRRAPRKFRYVHRLLRQAGHGPGKLLELGCSYGSVLEAFRRAGWQVEGVELDQRAASYARATLRLLVHQGTLDQALPALAPPYDALTAYHVIEHIPDPVGFCRVLHRLGSPGSALVLATPNAGAAVARLTKGWWEWFAPPEHVHVFSSRSLARILEEAGFHVRRSITRRGDAHGTLFELGRATVKRALGSDRDLRAGSAARADAPSQRPWYAAAGRISDMVGAPLEMLLAGAFRLGWQAGPELVVVATRR